MSFPEDCQEELNQACAQIEEQKQQEANPSKTEVVTRECEPSWKAIVFGKGKAKKPKGPTRQSSDEEGPRDREVSAEGWEAESGEGSAYGESGPGGRGGGYGGVQAQSAFFADQQPGALGAGVLLGHSWITDRGSDVKKAYLPILRIGLEGSYQVFPMFKVALVGEFEYLNGSSVNTKELRVNEETLDDTGETSVTRWQRDVGAVIDQQWTIGLRPTARLNAHAGLFEFFAGIGAGVHYFSTSGRWRTKLSLSEKANSDAITEEDQIQWTGDDEAYYSFKEADVGLYAVAEAAAIARFMDRRYGIGLLFTYTVPIHWNIEPDVTVERNFGDDHFEARPVDYADTFIRHLSAMDMFTLSLSVDTRF